MALGSTQPLVKMSTRNIPGGERRPVREADDPSTSGSSKWSLSLRFSHKNPVYASPLPTRATCPAHLILLDFIFRKYWVRSTYL